MKIKNKKGGDRIISVYWFVILFMVAAAVVYMVSIFYGQPYDVRELEADILTNRVAGCISNAGYIVDLDSDFQQNFLSKCGLNFEVEDIHGWKQEGQYYVWVEVSNFSSGQIIFSTESGNSNLKGSCEFEGKNFPVCLERALYVIDKNNAQYKVNIFSIVRKTEKNVQ